MHISKRFRGLVKSLLLISLTGVIAQCSDKEMEKAFIVQLGTKNPLVRQNKITFNDVDIEPNWFDQTFKVTNTTGRSVRIEDVSFYVNVDGSDVGPLSFDLGNLVETDLEGNTHNYTTFCTYTSSGTAIDFATCLEGKADPTLVGDATPAPLAKVLRFYIGGIPDPQLTDNLAYPVRLEIKGVYLDASGADSDRFEKHVYFTTR